jgi:hypothetical protein
MITTGRSAQVVAAPVIDHVLAVAIFGRKAPAPAELVIRPCTPFVPSLVVAIRIAAVIAAILLAASLRLLVAIPVLLGKGKASCSQG